MLESLKGIEVLVGREPEKGNILLCINYNDVQKTPSLGPVNCVPKSVSRCVPQENSAHCKIVFDENGKIYVKNLKDQNVTFVDDHEVLSMCVDLSSNICLGKEKFVLPLERIIEVTLKYVGEIRAMQTMSVSHLEKVWSEYESECERITKTMQKRNKMRMIPMLIGGLSAVAIPVTNYLLPVPKWATIVISLISLVAIIKVFCSKDTSMEERKKAKDKLISNYVCPNPSCKHFLGEVPYKILKQNKKCQYCGAPWKLDLKLK